MIANRIVVNPDVSSLSGSVDATPGQLISPHAGAVAGGGVGSVSPGVRISPAYVGTLRTKARIAAVQSAFKVFIFVS
jgi:2,4-dienoyl-CoA reductase-like NADH-dependent reductase (Old Yellow Enzyme family)